MKFFKFIGLMSIMVFSFFLTDFVTDVAINNNSLMKTIKNNSDNYQVLSVDAIIDGNTIIPGIKGKDVDEIESYLNMKDFREFNENYLIYKSVIPDISLDDNKDKVIISGNRNKRNVSILIKDNNSVLKYSKDNNIKYSKLVKLESNLENIENINIENISKNFNDLDTILNKNKINKNICIINYSNIEECINNEYYLVKYNIEITNNNINNILNSIENGSIIFVNDNLKLDNYELLIKYLNSKDLKIVYLSELISE